MNRDWKQALVLGGAGVAAGLAARAVRDHFRAFDYRNRVVVVTGGSRGLGLEISRLLAREGARLAICARNRGELDNAARELRSLGALVITHVCDVQVPKQVTAFIADVRKFLGPVDVLINNAGVIQVGPQEEMTQADIEEAMNIHFWGPVRLIDQVLPEMRRRGAGRIVNIASIGGEVAIPHLLPYCASKFALVGYSDGLRAEVAKDGVTVTTVCPGLMRTGSHRNAYFKGRHREEYAWFSIGGAVPVLTCSSRSAARQIVEACRYGRAHLTISLPAKFASALNTLAPGLTGWLAAQVNKSLPAPGGVGTARRRGYASTSCWTPSWMTTLSDSASERNNEISTRWEQPGRTSEDPVDIASEDSFPASDPPAWTGAAGT